MINKFNSTSSETMNEVYKDLNSLAEAKNSVKNLMDYRKSLLDAKGNNEERINEFKKKAMAAIDELFEEYSAPMRKV